MSAERPRPNILFFFPDQHRFDWVGEGSGVPVRTPHLDALGRRGVRFTNALCASPLCAPERACLAAGKEYDRCRTPGNGVDYPLDQTTVYTRLRDSGYHVMGCGKFDLHKASFVWGTAGTALLDEWGFSDGIDNAGKWDAINSGREAPRDPYMAYLESHGLRLDHTDDFARRRGNKVAVHPTPLPDDAYCDNWIAANGLTLLRRAPSDTPWFIQINFTGPHDPWDITESMAALYDGVDFAPPNGCDGFPPAELNAVRQNYSAMVDNIDRWLGVFVEELQRRGELDTTLIVYSSDHGEMLGDHGRWGKSSFYQPSVGVPMVLAGPGVRQGCVHAGPATNLDLAATFLDAAGLPIPDDMDSRSLCSLLAGETDQHRDHVLSGLRGWRLVFDGRHKLIRDGDALRLFDLEADPLENRDGVGERPEVVEQLAALLPETSGG